MDNFDLVPLNNLFSILRSFVHINVLKLLWRKHFLKSNLSPSNCYQFCCWSCGVFTEATNGSVLRNLLKFTGKHLCLAKLFSCEFCEISKNKFYTEQLWATASVFIFSKNKELVCFFSEFKELATNHEKHWTFLSKIWPTIGSSSGW